MATYFVFQEDLALSLHRSQVVDAIQSGTLDEVREAWDLYQTLAEIQITALPQEGHAYAKAQTGLELAKATIWLEAGDWVRYWRGLLSAEVYALNRGFDLPEAFVTTLREARHEDTRTPAEFLQAQASELHDMASGKEKLASKLRTKISELCEEAVQSYIERGQGEPSVRERGLVNYRLAQCYQALLEYNPERSQEFHALFETSAKSAFSCLCDQREINWAIRDLWVALKDVNK